jgi:hypothetical protein
MNPSTTQTNSNNVSPENLLEKAFENNEFTPIIIPQIDEENLVTHSDDHKAEIRNSWAEFYALRTEEITKLTAERPASKTEVQRMVIEQQFQPHAIETPKTETHPTNIIKKQTGSTSAWTEAGIKVVPDVKDIGKSLFGALNIFREIFMDTANLLTKAFTEKVITPEQAKKNAEKKAKQKEKNARIQAFYDKMAAQKASVVTVEADRFQIQEKENINKTVKLSTSYKGIKDSVGRLTVYAASMFEREQMEEDKKVKKIEKEQKMKSATGPDLNLDKAAEGGFLSSTGGQGAG